MVLVDYIGIFLHMHQYIWPHTVYIYVIHLHIMVFNATFNNISVISWRSVLLGEETGGTGEKNRPIASH
jgi:hypothetical protein